MTEDELDLLASAYLDGEATSEEVVMVERDPALLARVENLRAVSEQLSVTTPPSAELKEQHLAAALAAFSVDGDGAADDSEDTTVMPENQAAATEVMPPAVVDISDRDASADVIDLTGRSRTPKRHTGPGATGKPSRTVPSWLPVAAALLILGGGGAWLLSQASGDGEDSADTAAESFDESAEEETTTDEAESDEALRADDDGDAESVAASAAPTDSEEADDAMEDDAMEDEEAMEEEVAAEDDGEAEGNESSPTGETGGFFPEDPVLFFDSPPTVEQALVDAVDPREDLSLSACADVLPELTELEPVSYLPIEIAGEPAELFVLVNPDGSETAIIVNTTDCSQVTP